MKGYIVNPIMRTVREIEVSEGKYEWLKLFKSHPKSWSILEEIFMENQNEFNPQPSPSMTAGDILIIGELRFLCLPTGWKLTTPKEERELFQKLTENPCLLFSL